MYFAKGKVSHEFYELKDTPRKLYYHVLDETKEVFDNFERDLKENKILLPVPTKAHLLYRVELPCSEDQGRFTH